MEGSSSDAMARQNLQERLLNSVKQVQVYFGARQEIATESDTRVSALCVEWEMVLTHAARKPKPKNSLRLTGRTEGVSLWPLAKLCVSPEDLHRFYRLNHIKSELGRGRAWLRGAINERTLENYMHTILAQEEELRRLYEPEAFLLDQERSSTLPIMAAGLSSIIFSISIDSTYLNTPSRSVEVPAVSLPPVSSVPVSPVPCVEVPHTQSETHPPLPTTDTDLPAQQTFPSHHRHLNEAGDDDVIAVRAKGKKKKHKKVKSQSPQLGTDRGTERGTSPDHAPSISLEVERTLIESTSSSSSRLSLDSVNDDRQAPLYVALTTPTDVVSGEALAAASATALVLSASSASLSASSAPLSTEQCPRLATSSQRKDSTEPDHGQPSQTPDHGSPVSSMRTAVLSLSKMKDDLEVQNRDLQRSESELRARVGFLEQEVEKNVEAIDEEREAHSSQKLALERENDLLREQLKKYVGIVQAQRRDPSDATAGSARNTESSMEQSLTEYVNTAEKKLQDMAEMYADLMELNERLHRNLADKEGTVSSLVRLLREASIEVPLPPHELPAAAMETRVRLVEVWIPSVIKKGRGPDGFHVYQVFVSVKGVEWNVYRRYTEFRDFHRQLQKHLPQLASFNFPPKKAIGNKSTQVVEERRQRLQEYLRFVIKTCGSHSASGSSNRSKPIINHSICKEVLVTIFPFFKEDFNQDPVPTVQPPSYSGL